MKIEYTMTDEIAFRLGKFDFPHFYSDAIWKLNKEPFPLLYFFDWSMGMGTPCKNEEGHPTDWEGFNLHGRLKTETIKEISHKLNYIRGRLDSYSVKITEESILICYANSYDFRDFLAECLEDVIKDKFVLLPQVDGELGRSYNRNCPKYQIIKSETVGTIPGNPHIELKADKEIINYLIGKKEAISIS